MKDEKKWRKHVTRYIWVILSGDVIEKGWVGFFWQYRSLGRIQLSCETLELDIFLLKLSYIDCFLLELELYTSVHFWNLSCVRLFSSEFELCKYYEIRAYFFLFWNLICRTLFILKLELYRTFLLLNLELCAPFYFWNLARIIFSRRSLSCMQFF